MQWTVLKILHRAIDANKEPSFLRLHDKINIKNMSDAQFVIFKSVPGPWQQMHRMSLVSVFLWLFFCLVACDLFLQASSREAAPYYCNYDLYTFHYTNMCVCVSGPLSMCEHISQLEPILCPQLNRADASDEPSALNNRWRERGFTLPS